MLASGAAVTGLLVAKALAGATAALAQDDRVFTVGNYPVSAQAQDAVTAKDRAIAEGQRAAFRSLLKRLTPVTSYKALPALKSVPAGNLVSGIAVRSERNSSTSYTASLDFAFDGHRVRDLLRQRGIPFVDQQARETAVVLVLHTSGPATGGLTAAAWREAWNGLDFDNSLAPVKLHDRSPAITPDLVKAALTNPEAPLRTIAVLARSGQALLAIAEPDNAARRLHVTLSGVDAVGPLLLRRTWRMDSTDPVYTAELAAVVSQGILEGRWKATTASPVAAMPAGDQPLQQVQLLVEFRSLQEWQRLRRQIEDTPGVADVMVGGVSSSGASMALRYPGGGPAFSAALGPVGIDVRGGGGTWIARGAY